MDSTAFNHNGKLNKDMLSTSVTLALQPWEHSLYNKFLFKNEGSKNDYIITRRTKKKNQHILKSWLWLFTFHWQAKNNTFFFSADSNRTLNMSPCNFWSRIKYLLYMILVLTDKHDYTHFYLQWQCGHVCHRFTQDCLIWPWKNPVKLEMFDSKKKQTT